MCEKCVYGHCYKVNISLFTSPALVTFINIADIMYAINMLHLIDCKG